VLVIIHTTVARLSGFPVDSLCNNEKAMLLFDKLYSICKELLAYMKRLLQETKECPDVAHNLSFEGNIFAVLNGVILGTAFGIWLGIEDIKVVNEANAILDMQTATIHPCIAQALRVLTAVKSGDAASRNDIRQSCFLLPSQTGAGEATL